VCARARARVRVCVYAYYVIYILICLIMCIYVYTHSLSLHVQTHHNRLSASISSSNRYLEVLNAVELYIDVRWTHFLEVMAQDTREVLVSVCEVYRVSEQILGDVLDRKLSQVEYAGKEEKEHLENFKRKWEELNPCADDERDKARQAQTQREKAENDVARIHKLKSLVESMLLKCRPALLRQGIAVDPIQDHARNKEWDLRRLRLYQVQVGI
jgi:hypothetical protein